MVRLLALGVLLGACGAALGQAAPEQLKERGVLFFAPFEGTTRAVVAEGQADPWVQRDLLFTVGAIGQGVQMLNKRSRYVVMPDGQQRKYVNGQSMLVYEGLGNIYRRRGTLAFWVLSPFDASNTDLLTGAGGSGPCVFGVSSKGVYDAFLSMTRREAFFDTVFSGHDLDGKTKRFGTYGQKMIPLWKAETWKHVAITWDDRRGWGVYLDGAVIEKVDRPMRWEMFEPDTIALGSVPMRARDLWPVNNEYVFDEFIVFCRPLTPEEVILVRDGKYAELRVLQPADWPFDAEARRRELGLDRSAGRAVIDAAQGPAAVRQIAVEDVDMKFMRRYALVDGSLNSKVTFEDGGVPFDTPARFRFTAPSQVNHVVAAMTEPNGSYLFESDPSAKLADLRAGRTHIAVEARRRADLSVFFKGSSEACELGFYEIGPASGPRQSGSRRWLSGEIEAGQYPDAAQVVLQAPEPGDRPVLYAAAGAPTPTERVIKRAALRHTFLVLDADNADRFVGTLRLNAKIRPSKATFAALVRAHDPLIPDRVALDADVEVKWDKAGEWGRLALDLGAPGLIVPAGGRLVVDLVLDAEWELAMGGAEGTWLEIEEGDARRIGHEFALAQLRQMWDGFLRRLNQNRFLQAGEDRERNPIWRGLTLAEKYDPDNEQVKAWFGWSRLRPWPAFDYGYLDRQAGPRWAVYMREAALSMQAIVHWWLDNRSNDFGYIVGPGNQWNDITDYYSTFVVLGPTVSDTRLIDAIEKYQDAHWNSGRMVNGYAWMMTDMLHALEEGTEIQPNLHVLRPGVPRHVYRDLYTASHYGKWMGRNSFGHTHVKSNFFNAERMMEKGVQGRDLGRFGESLTAPGRWVWWYNGHSALGKLLTEHADAWLADTLRATKTKPAGVIPSAVQFETDELFTDGQASPGVLDLFLTTYLMTGDRKYLEPIRLALEKKEAVSGAKWALSNSKPFVDYRLLTADTTFDKQFHEMSEEAYEKTLRGDGFFQRGFEYAEGQALYRWVIDPKDEDLIEMLKYAIRNNRRGFYAYTWTDPPTDRVNPWGRDPLAVAMLGGRVFNFRWSMPLPTAAFAWEGTDTDLMSLVLENKPDGVTMLVHNFKDKPVQAGMRALRLAEGTYRLSTAPCKAGGREPEGAPREEQVEMRRFTPMRLGVAPGQTLWVRLALVKERPRAPRPDLAVTLAEAVKDGKLMARVHNLGGAASPESVLRLVDKAGKALAEAKAPALTALDGFEPRFADVALAAPAGASLDGARLAVDPDGKVDEINESNNGYALAAGVPPPVETQKPPYAKTEKVVRW